MIGDTLEAWRTNNRINLYLIDQISDEAMSCTLSKRGGRDVAGVSPESNHRGSILLTMKECGHNLEKKHRYAIWNWDRI